MKDKSSIIFLWVLLILFVAACNEQANKNSRSHAEQSEGWIRSLYKEEVKYLSRNSKLTEALKYIKDHDDETLANQIALAKIQAPSFKEDKFGKDKYFEKLLRQYGADSVWIDAIGNVIGLRKGIKRDSLLAIAAHLDTVFPEGTDVDVTQRGDTLFAPGISDNGRGLTTVLTILRTLGANKIQTRSDILFIGNVGEEGLGDLSGMRQLFNKDGLNIDAFISIDGSSSTSITNGALGSHRYKVTFNGPGGHSWGKFGIANPAHALGQAISNFSKKADTYTNHGAKTSYNVGKIGGGTSINSIPYSAWMEVDMRSLSQDRLNEIDTLFHQSVFEALEAQNKIRRSGPPLTVDIKKVGDRPSGHIDLDEPLVQRAMAATVYFGNEPRLKTSSGDTNIPISKGIPGVAIGGGGHSGGAHSLDEWFFNKNGYKGIQRAFLIVVAQAGVIIK